MQWKGHEVGYDERLFGGGLRTRLHMARFHFVLRTLRAMRLRPRRVIELGCHNGRALDVIADNIGWPERYLGLDANWDRCLYATIHKYGERPGVTFQTCKRPDDIHEEEPFDLGLCLETLEHVAPDLVEPYLARLARAVRGHIIITGPIERGAVFVGRHVPKLLLGKETFRYGPMDFVYSALGKLDRVKRAAHIGYDDRVAIQQIAMHFDVMKVVGIVPGIRPYRMNFQFGVIAKSKTV